MRFFFYIVSTALAAGPTDLCTQLCDRDGPLVCTGGSWTKPDGTCQAYLFRGDPSLNDPCYHTRTTATSCPAGGQPVRADDVPRLLAVSGTTTSAPTSTPMFRTVTMSAGTAELARSIYDNLHRLVGRENIRIREIATAVARPYAEFVEAFNVAVDRFDASRGDWSLMGHIAAELNRLLANGETTSTLRHRSLTFMRVVAGGSEPLREGSLVDRAYATAHAGALLAQLNARFSGVLDLELTQRVLTDLSAGFKLAFYRAAWGASAERWGLMTASLNELTEAYRAHRASGDARGLFEDFAILEGGIRRDFERLSAA